MKVNLIVSTLMALALATGCKKNAVVSDSQQADATGQPVHQVLLSGGAVIQGVKWKNPMIAQDSAASAKFETEGLTYAQAAQGLANNNVKDVVLKVAELKILPNGVGEPQRNNQVIAMLKALRTVGINVYLWERQWLQKDHAENGGDEEFATEMAAIINQAKGDGVDDALKGIALIENNLENTKDVLSKSLSIARKINSKTNNWLKNKSFFMPGAALGSYFKGINTTSISSTFFGDMAPEVKNFAFIYKHMKSQPVDKCTLGSYNTGWVDTLGQTTTKTVTEQISYLNNTMGLLNLQAFVNNHKANYPSLCNVIFWGDSGDGITNMARTSIQAVHKLLVEDNLWKDYFFDMTYAASTATGEDLTKYILTVSSSGAVNQNTAMNASGTMGIFTEWNKWNWTNPGY